MIKCTRYILYDTKFWREKSGETVHTTDWQVMFWQTLKITKVPKIIIMCLPFAIHGEWLK